jgi:hypothetical protein
MFEDGFCLPFCRISEIDPDVHTSRSAQHGIDALDMICSGKNKPVGDYQDN